VANCSQVANHLCASGLKMLDSLIKFAHDALLVMVVEALTRPEKQGSVSEKRLTGACLEDGPA
jgi:hypothetical protein